MLTELIGKIVFIPYVENSDGTKLLHVVTNTTLGVDFWTPFYVGPA